MKKDLNSSDFKNSYILWAVSVLPCDNEIIELIFSSKASSPFLKVGNLIKDISLLLNSSNFRFKNEILLLRVPKVSSNFFIVSIWIISSSLKNSEKVPPIFTHKTACPNFALKLTEKLNLVSLFPASDSKYPVH